MNAVPTPTGLGLGHEPLSWLTALAAEPTSHHTILNIGKTRHALHRETHYDTHAAWSISVPEQLG